MGGPGSGRRSGGRGASKSSGKRPYSFGVNINKMRSVKIPKDIKRKGIDSEAYKNWVYKNWT